MRGLSQTSHTVAAACTALPLVAVLALWIMSAHPDAPRSVDAAAGLLVVTLAFVLGALGAQAHPALPVVTVALAVLGAFVVTLPLSLSGAHAAPPVGYGNANGALLLAGAAACLVGAPHVPDAWRQTVWGGALLMTMLVAFTASVAALVSCVALLALWPARRRGRNSVWMFCTLALVVVPVLLTVALAYQAMPLQTSIAALISPERIDLWSDAVAMVESHPTAGVGPGRFQELSNVSVADSDLSRAHSGALQVAASLGLVGLGLVTALLIWLVVTLGRDALLVGMFVLPASIDYVLEFVWVAAAMAVVLGSAWMTANDLNRLDRW